MKIRVAQNSYVELVSVKFIKNYGSNTVWAEGHFGEIYRLLSEDALGYLFIQA